MISPFYEKRKNDVSIHIFKTNIKTKQEVNVIKTLLNSYLEIMKFSIDLEDIDKVLRIEADKSLNKKFIIENIKSKGFICEELE